jgi:[ribosomal protein S18]-alanine N-acetyltransferase
MRLPLRRREFALTPLRRGDGDAIARLHAEDFAQPWSGGEFSALLVQETVFGYTAREVGRMHGELAGFILARIAAGEAEILTVAVARSCRRMGLGRKLMEAVLRELHVQRAEALFLEVDEANAAAIALYRRLGFREIGKRPAYYEASDRKKSSALVMRRDLR